MKFMTTWSGSSTHFRAAITRSLQPGARPPAGITILGRWHGPDTGFCLAETADIKEIYVWTSQWCDQLDFMVTPVMEDAEAAEVFKQIDS